MRRILLCPGQWNVMFINMNKCWMCWIYHVLSTLHIHQMLSIFIDLFELTCCMRTINYIFQPRYETNNLLIQFDLCICLERWDWQSIPWTKQQQQYQRSKKWKIYVTHTNGARAHTHTHLFLCIFIASFRIHFQVERMGARLW